MNIIVSDDEYNTGKTECADLGEKVEEQLDAFYKAIEGMIENEEIMGLTADNMLLYAQHMKQSLQTYFDETLKEQGENHDSFLEEIDKADSFLY